MRNRGSIDVIAAAVCIGAAAFAFFALWNRPAKFDSAIHAEIGRTMAREALAVLPKGGRIVVIARDTATYVQPAMEASLQEIQKEAAKTGATVTVKTIQLDPLRPVEVPPGDFYETIRRASSNDVILSLLGPPVLDPDQQAKLKGPKPKIIALCTGSLAAQADLAGLGRSGLLHAAVVNRAAKGTATNPTALHFDQLYTMLRSEELGKQLP